jgi:hypothetical protein
MKMIKRLWFLLAIPALLLPSAAISAIPLEMPLQGVVRDNAGNPANGDFEVTFALYPSEGAEAVEAVWWNTQNISVVDGIFVTRLGEGKPLDPATFTSGAPLWLGMAIESEDELPRRPLGSSAYSLHAATSAGLACSGCVGLSHLTAAAQSSLVDQSLVAVAANGYTTVASGLYVDDSTLEIGASDVQAALEKLNEKIDAGGGGGGNVNEGAGTVSRYSNQWGMPSYGSAVEYIHLMNPTTPKVHLYLYGGENTGFASSNNLIVSNTYAPNTYSGGANGEAGGDTLTVTNAGAFNQGDHILVYQTVGNDPGHWELNAVTAINGNSLKLAKDLEYAYVDADNNTRAQVVIAASYNNFEVVNGGVVRPSSTLGSSGEYGGIVYIRARQLTVKSGGLIEADGDGFRSDNPWQGWSTWHVAGDSECNAAYDTNDQSNNCSGGGAGLPHSCCCETHNYGAGGGGNQTAGIQGKYHNGNSLEGGQGGTEKGVDDGSELHMGGAGGSSGQQAGGHGGGIVILGAETIIVESGGAIRANGNNGGGGCHAAGGGGAGGTISLFADTIQIDGTVEVTGGFGGDSTGNADGGAGGEGWILQHPPIAGIINQSYATGVEIWIDGQEVTASVGDPNGKGSPHWNAETKKWGATGTESWSSGPLDLSNVANWTLGEHTLKFKETGGAGGDLKAYLYVINPYTESSPPANDTCATPLSIDPNESEVVLSGTTEDVMGKTLATDASSAEGCGGIGGPDVAYRIDLAARSLINAELIAPFSAKLYLKGATCADGEVVYCADKNFSTNPLEAGTYFLFVDSDAPQAKGDFTLKVSTTPAPLPPNDTCEDAFELIFNGAGEAAHTTTSIYSLDQYKGLCPSALSGGPDVVYKFTAGTGETLNVNLTSDFESILYVKTLACDGGGVPLSCSATGSLTIQGLAGGQYWLFVDGAQEKSWGDYTLNVSLE